MDDKFKVMHTRDIYFALKEQGGNAIQYLMKRFHFATEESLFEAIKKVSPSEADTLIRDLMSKAKKDPKNKKPKDKKPKNKKPKDKKPKNKKPKAANDSEIKMEQKQQDNLVSEGNLAGVVHEPKPEAVHIEECALNKSEKQPEEETKTLDKAALEEEEAKISVELQDLETQYQQEKSNKEGIRREAAQAQRAADELARLLKAQRANVCEIVERYNACGTRMEELASEMRPRRERLEELRVQIAEFEKVTILVYQDGTIEVENAEIPLVSDEEVNAQLILLINTAKVGKITVDGLKAIAKLLKMVETYRANRTPFELLFDSTEVQSFWETVATTENTTK